MAQQPLKGKVALVTGASSGIGRATALTLADAGANIVCCDLTPNPNPKGYEPDLDKTTVQLVLEKGAEAIFQRVDISSASQAESAFETALVVSLTIYQTSSLNQVLIHENRADLWTC